VRFRAPLHTGAQPQTNAVVLVLQRQTTGLTLRMPIVGDNDLTAHSALFKGELRAIMQQTLTIQAKNNIDVV
jgi:hypothetical protein